MTKSLVIRAVITWLLFLPVPIINGLLREKWYKPIVGQIAGHQIGTVVVSVFFVIYAYISLSGKVTELTANQLWLVGCLWLTLTLVFEFGLGFATGRSLKLILVDYNIFAGRIWPIVPFVTLTAPFIIRWIKA